MRYFLAFAILSLGISANTFAKSAPSKTNQNVEMMDSAQDLDMMSQAAPSNFYPWWGGDYNCDPYTDPYCGYGYGVGFPYYGYGYGYYGRGRGFRGRGRGFRGRGRGFGRGRGGRGRGGRGRGGRGRGGRGRR